MSGANYAFCPGCGKKALYVGEQDLPENVSVYHDDCLDVMYKTARHEGWQAGYAAAMDDVHRCVCGHVHRDGCPDCTCTSYQAARS